MIHRPAHEVELYRDDDCYRVFVDLPGFDSDHIDVRWVDRHLSIAAERSDGTAETSLVFHHCMGVPKAVRGDAITATYRDGVLDIELPIAEEEKLRGQTVEIEE